MCCAAYPRPCGPPGTAGWKNQKAMNPKTYAYLAAAILRDHSEAFAESKKNISLTGFIGGLEGILLDFMRGLIAC